MTGVLLVCLAAAQTAQLVPVDVPGAGWWAEFSLSGVEVGPGNPFDPAQIAVEAEFTPESGGSTRVPAFWARSGGDDGGWRVRWFPQGPGKVAYTVHVSLNGGSSEAVGRGEFGVAAADKPGMLMARVEPTRKRWFQRSDGTPLPLLGAHVCWGVLKDYETWLDGLAAARMNFTRVWMAPFGFGIEDQPGSRLNYDQEKADALDTVLRMAEERGIYVMLCLDFHGIFQDKPDMWGSNDFWFSHPYNKTQGGPCNKQNEFFTSPEARSLYQKRLRYIVARWGACPALFAWEFFNEYDNVLSKIRRADVLAWHGDMSAFLKTLDPWKHPVTTSLTGSSEDKGLWTIDGLDIAQFHLYLDGKSQPAGRRVQETARRFRDRYEKPMVFGEYGVSFRGPGTEEDPFLRGVRQGVWSALLSGSAGTVFPWWWDNLHPRGGWEIWAALARFLEGTGVGGADWAPLEGAKAVFQKEDGELGGACDAYALGNGKSILAYVVDPDYHYPAGATVGEPASVHARLTLPMPPAPGAVRVEVWDPVKGEKVSGISLSCCPEQIEVLLPFAVDCAVRVLPSDQ